MSLIAVYAFIVVGVAISVVLPILRQGLPAPPGGQFNVRAVPGRLGDAAKPYLVTTAFSLIAGVLVLAVSGNTLKNWAAAILAGYAWDSTLQKLKG